MLIKDYPKIYFKSITLQMNTLRIQIQNIALFLLLIGVVGIGQSTQAQSTEIPLSTQQNALDERHIREGLKECEYFLTTKPNNHTVLQKAAYFHYLIGWLYADNSAQKEHYIQFFDYANRAKQINPQDYQTSVLLAGAKSKMAAYLSVGDQVRIARELAQDVQLLMERRADDPQVMYISSWLNFKIGRVSLPKKFLASIFYDGLPEGMSVENAFILLEKAIHSKPHSIVYQYDLGLFYQRTGNDQKALVQYAKVTSMLPHSPEGFVYQHRAETRMKAMNASTNPTSR